MTQAGSRAISGLAKTKMWRLAVTGSSIAGRSRAAILHNAVAVFVLELHSWSFSCS